MASHKTKIGLFYNLSKDFPSQENYSGDLHLEWDSIETIGDIRETLKDIGYQVIDYGNPKLLLKNNVIKSIDVVFSICEMQGYRFRESIVPCVCELLKIPYAFSTPDTLMISLDKNLCNLLLKQQNIPIPESYCFEAVCNNDYSLLKNYPYFIKPSCEGSSVGINNESVVFSQEELINQIEFVVSNYKQPALVQKYLSNEDITIGVLEKNGCVVPLTPLIGKVGQFVKPLPKSSKLYSKITEIAVNAFKGIKCRDVARIDLKLSDSNDVYFLEINPLPLFSKTKGYLMESARLSGYSYQELMEIIVENTKTRYGLK